MGKLKFLLDENISYRLFSLLRKQKFDVESVQSLNLLGISNGKLFEKSIQLERIIITFDKDFKKVINKPHFGIILIDVHPARDPYVLPIFEKFIKNPEILNLSWANTLVILKSEGFEIIK